VHIRDKGWVPCPVAPKMECYVWQRYDYQRRVRDMKQARAVAVAPAPAVALPVPDEVVVPLAIAASGDGWRARVRRWLQWARPRVSAAALWRPTMAPATAWALVAGVLTVTLMIVVLISSVVIFSAVRGLVVGG
jgi:hypothetical protein